MNEDNYKQINDIKLKLVEQNIDQNRFFIKCLCIYVVLQSITSLIPQIISIFE